MSKLEEQKALPRRKLFKPCDELVPGLLGVVAPRPKRKAKKAKGKR